MFCGNPGEKRLKPLQPQIIGNQLTAFFAPDGEDLLAIKTRYGIPKAQGPGRKLHWFGRIAEERRLCFTNYPDIRSA